MDQVSLMLPTTPGEPPNGNYEYVDRGPLGDQITAEFPNGYGASVIRGPFTYGGPSGLYELGVLHSPKNSEGVMPLCYATPVTSDVLGWLSEDDVIGKLHEVAHLPPNADCSHDHSESWDPFNPAEGEASADQALTSLIGQISDGLSDGGTDA